MPAFPKHRSGAPPGCRPRVLLGPSYLEAVSNAAGRFAGSTRRWGSVLGGTDSLNSGQARQGGEADQGRLGCADEGRRRGGLAPVGGSTESYLTGPGWFNALCTRRSSVFFHQGQCETEFRALLHLRFDPDPVAKAFYHALADLKSNTGTGDILPVQPFKHAKNRLMVFSGDAYVGKRL